MSLAIMVAVSACAAPAEDNEAIVAQPLTTLEESAQRITSFCGVSPSSISYWATEWQRDIMDYEGWVGGCDYDQSCMPSCWGTTTDWTSWWGPLIQCPCGAQ